MITNHHNQENYSPEFKRHLKRSEIDSFHSEPSVDSENFSEKLLRWWQEFWRWTGITEKKGLEIAQVFLLPILLAAGGIWWNSQAEQRARLIAQDRYRQDALEQYITLITNLADDKTITKSQYSLEKAKTNATLQLLKGDKSRRSILFDFLREAELLTKTEQPILEGINLKDIDLQEANLTGAKLKGADLRNTDLRRASLNSACLYQAKLSKANLTEARLIKANLRGAYLIETELRKAQLLRANLIGANLDRATLDGANLTNALYDSATKFPKEFDPLNRGMMAIKPHTNLSNKNLNQVDLPKVNLQGADLQQAQLRGANLMEANLSGANLIKVDLSKANLSSNNLVGVRLIDAQLTGANLREASLRGAILTGADLTGADLTGADLTGTELTNVNLKGARGFSKTDTRPRLCDTTLPDGSLTTRDCLKVNL